MLTSLYYVLTRQQDYVDLGAACYGERDRTHTENRLVRWLEAIGQRVQLEEAALHNLLSWELSHFPRVT